MLGAAEELSEFVVSRQRRVFDVGLQPQHIAQASFGEPDDVVVLVPRPGHIAKLGVAGHRSPSFLLRRSQGLDAPTPRLAPKTVMASAAVMPCETLREPCTAGVSTMIVATPLWLSSEFGPASAASRRERGVDFAG